MNVKTKEEKIKTREINAELELGVHIKKECLSVYTLSKKIVSDKFVFIKDIVITDYSTLIQSILLNIPINPVWVSEDRYGNYKVLTEKDVRIMNIIYYFINSKLKMCLIGSRFDGLFFKDLSKLDQSRFEDYIFDIRILSVDNCSHIKEEITRRISSNNTCS